MPTNRPRKPSSPKDAYRDLLKDPRWQKRRLQIMERDAFTCQHCISKTTTLHVHHRWYNNDAEGPWDYPDDALVTLCEHCHETETVYWEPIVRMLVQTLRRSGFSAGNLGTIAVALNGISPSTVDLPSLSFDIAKTIRNAVITPVR